MNANYCIGRRHRELPVYGRIRCDAKRGDIGQVAIGIPSTLRDAKLIISTSFPLYTSAKNGPSLRHSAGERGFFQLPRCQGTKQTLGG